MGKTLLKERKAKKQNGMGALSELPLPEETKLFDTHRKVLRMDGGGYDDENFIVDLPETHMKEHEIWKDRPKELEELKKLVDDYRQMLKLVLKINNQLLAVDRGTDKLSQDTQDFLNTILVQVHTETKERVKRIERWIRKRKDRPLIHALISPKGVGPITVAELLVDIDIAKAKHPSSLWAYVGYDKPSIDRYQKGQMGGGNKPLRCVLFNLGASFLKCAAPYSEVYYQRKAKLEVSEKLVRERAKGNGQIKEIMWKDAMPIHRHLDALRVMNKHFLADLWFVWRTLAGLDTNDLYVKEHLGHASAIINPKERGWEY